MLTVWGRKTSSNVQVVMWCVGELGLEHVRHDVGHRYGGNRTAEFLAMNPNGLVPVVRDNDEPPIFESAAILRYLASRYGGDAFWPRAPGARAQVDKWAEWARTNIALNFTVPIFWRVVRTAPRDQDPAAIASAIGFLGQWLDVAERQLVGKPFLCGDAFTLADIQFGQVLYRYYDMRIARPEHPEVRRYYDRLCDRMAFREHMMVSYEELRAG